MQFFVKYFAIIFSSFYCYFKLLHILRSKKQWFISFAAVTLFSFLAVFTENIFPLITALCVIFLSFLFFSLTTHTAAEAVLPVSIISYGFSYLLFSVSAVIVGIVFGLFGSYDQFSHLLIQLIAAVLQAVITLLIFHVRRFRRGMPFLWNPTNSTLLMFISLIILFASYLLKNATQSLIYTIPLFAIFLFGIFLFMFWRSHITSSYVNKLREKEVKEMNEQLKSYETKMRKLQEENGRLAQIIHKDNKMIPSMEYAVKEFLHDNGALSDSSRQKGEKLLQALEAETLERRGMLAFQEQTLQSIPSTGNSSVDMLLSFMKKKAVEQHIELDITFSCPFSKLLDCILEQDLTTLLGDLLENAIIATSSARGSKILLTIDILGSFPTISVFDSGTSFPTEVLLSLGKEQITTHQATGGSGIGLMTLWEIAKKYSASLSIDEFHGETGLYSKKLSISFDQKNQFVLLTYRDISEIAKLGVRDDLLVVSKL